jgi:hypothetical protein
MYTYVAEYLGNSLALKNRIHHLVAQEIELAITITLGNY